MLFYRGKPCVLIEECPDIDSLIIKPEGKANFLVLSEKVVDENGHPYVIQCK